jgi:hypothetical protein
MWQYEVMSAKTEVFHVRELSCNNGKFYSALMSFTMVRIASGKSEPCVYKWLDFIIF